MVDSWFLPIFLGVSYTPEFLGPVLVRTTGDFLTVTSPSFS